MSSPMSVSMITFSGVADAGAGFCVWAEETGRMNGERIIVTVEKHTLPCKAMNLANPALDAGNFRAVLISHASVSHQARLSLRCIRQCG